jgi:hypothetical protein
MNISEKKRDRFRWILSIVLMNLILKNMTPYTHTHTHIFLVFSFLFSF